MVADSAARARVERAVGQITATDIGPIKGHSRCSVMSVELRGAEPSGTAIEEEQLGLLVPKR